MSLGDEEYTVDQLYDISLDPDKLKSYPGFLNCDKLASDSMTFHYDLPYDEIKEFVEEEKKTILSKVPEDVIKSNGVKWEHVGSTSIKGDQTEERDSRLIKPQINI